MTVEELTQKQLEIYGEAFDSLVDKETLPEKFPKGDLLGKYLQKIVADNLDRLQKDPLWREVLRENILAYFYVLLLHFQEIERQKEKERELIALFMNADGEQKRAMWAMIRPIIEAAYSDEEINLEEYQKQMDGENIDAVLGAVASDWAKAFEEKTDRLKKSIIEYADNNWQSTCQEVGNRDYEKRLQLDRFMVQYPALKEIVRIMGREKEEDHNEKDSVIRKYLPSTLSRLPTVEEINRVVQGDNVPRALPSELALMADAVTETLFFKRYAVKELQQLSSPSRDKPVKEDKDKNKPRLTKGPIVVALDTSGSMMGEPIKIATSLLFQLLRMAKKENRKCFLISFSVQAKSIDLSKPGNWNNLETFLSESYSGGTDGEQMLSQAMDVLESGTFEMADFLVISDFEFPKPKSHTQDRMNHHRASGTKFYGLRIGRDYNIYIEILDKIWHIN